tara:strand:+ start:358 stop:639 length:282 start_codon:yes stop_codon:yes gene_type:complete
MAKFRIGRLKTITQYIFRDQIEFDTSEYPEIPEDATPEQVEEWVNENMYDADLQEINTLVDQEEIYDNSQKEESYYFYIQPTLEDLRNTEEEE